MNERASCLIADAAWRVRLLAKPSAKEGAPLAVRQLPGDPAGRDV
jgi:hypothetical protein